MKPAPQGKLGRTSLTGRFKKEDIPLGTVREPDKKGALGGVNELAAAFKLSDHLFVVDGKGKLELQLQAQSHVTADY